MRFYSLKMLGVMTLVGAGVGAGELEFRRGDANADGRLDIGDPIFSLGYIFGGGDAPPCLDGADSNDDGRVDISDAVFTLFYLFQGNRPPPAPGPEACGPDATADDVACASYPCPAINEAPLASFSASEATGEAPLEVTFDASGSVDPDGTIMDYEWDFGDGQSGMGMTVSHTYSEAGTYFIHLTVVDDQGLEAQSGGTLHVYPPGLGDSLDTAPGCGGVYNPEQIVEYHLTLSPGDWQGLVADTTNSIYFRADFRCGNSVPIMVGLRRKRSGSLEKVGLKLDTNRYVEDQEYYGLHKLSLENGISEGDSEASIRALLAEYLSWRLMVLSGAHSGRAALAKLFVNGEPLGVYVNVEQVDKVFLKNRLGNSNGWLYKKSGGDDGWKTNEGVPDPYASYFCFWENGNASCATPSAEELRLSLSEHLDIGQLLRMGAVNAVIGNADAPLVKDNNYYFYDWSGGPRVYFPWDLDTVMKQRPHVFTGLATKYTEVLFSHWEDDYDQVLTDLLSTALRLEVILGEIDRALRVAGSELDTDPYLVGDTAVETGHELRIWWTARHAEASTQVSAH